MRRYIISLLFVLGLYGHSLAQPTVGTILHDSLAHDGYTLITPASSNLVVLVDNCGFEINRWEAEGTPGLSAYLLPGGKLLRTRRSGTSFNAGGTGGAIDRYSWDGELEWTWTYSTDEVRQHHDIEPLPNGNILILAWEAYTGAEAIALGRDSTLLGDNGIWGEQIVEIRPIGTDSAEIVWEWHVMDHVIQDRDSSGNNFGVVAERPERIDINFVIGQSADWLHCNSVDYNPELDLIMLSSRNLSELWIIDHSTSSEEARDSVGGRLDRGGDILYRWGNPRTYRRGGSIDQQLFRQHDARWIEAPHPQAGGISVFNNGIGRPGTDFSEAILLPSIYDEELGYVIDDVAPYAPVSPSLVIGSSDDRPFFSNIMSGVQPLPNGNILVSSGNKGLAMELDTSGQVLWEYQNPITASGILEQEQDPRGVTVFRYVRYDLDDTIFQGQDLTPGDPVELNPIDYGCVLYDMTVSSEQLGTIDYSVFPNPTTGMLSISGSLPANTKLLLYDMHGRLRHEADLESASAQLPATLASGWYLLLLESPTSRSYTRVLLQR